MLSFMSKFRYNTSINILSSIISLGVVSVKKIQHLVWVIMGIVILGVLISVMIGRRQVNTRVVAPSQDREEVIETVELPRTYNTYEAQVKFSPNFRSFEGTETIKYVHEFQTPTLTILLQLFANKNITDEERDELGYTTIEKLDITTAMVAGKEIKFTQKGTSLTLYLEDKLTYKGEVEIALTFKGTTYGAIKNNKESSEVILCKSFLPQIVPFEEGLGWVVTEPQGEEQFAYAEPGDYNVSIVSQKPVIATGTLVAVEQEGEVTSYHYTARKVRDFGLYIGDKLEKKEFALPQDRRLVIYSNKGENVDKLAQQVAEVFNYYNDILGTYPYEEFKIVDSNLYQESLSYPMMMICNLNKFEEVYDNTYLQIGKQWIPYIVCNNPKSKNWVNRGLEHYLAYRGTMSTEGVKSMVRYNIMQLNRGNEAKKLENTRIREEVLEPMKMLAQVEEAIGRDEWYTILRQYYKDVAFITTTNSKLMQQIITGYGSKVQFLEGQIEDESIQ